MTLTKWTPFIDPFEEMEKFMSKPGMSGFAPAIDVYETKDEVVVKAPLPGIDPKDVEITIENDILTIKGEAKRETEVDEKNYYRKEISSGGFFRSVALPSHVKSDAAKAESEEGMLKITIPKAEEKKLKTIKIEVKDKKGKK